MKLFHYTTSDGYDSVQSEGVIRSSLQGKYGSGVYLTDLNPDDHDKQHIAENLWKGGASRKFDRLDHHIQLEMPKEHVVEMRSHVYLYQYLGGSDLVLSDYDVLSKGDNETWQMSLVVATSGLVLATAGVRVAQLLYHNATEGRQTRSRALFETLLRLTATDDLHEMFSVKQSDDGATLRVYCKDCSKPVSEEYSGGFIFGSCIDEKALLCTLKQHRQSHLLFTLLTAVVVAAVGVAAIAVFGIQQWKRW